MTSDESTFESFNLFTQATLPKDGEVLSQMTDNELKKQGFHSVMKGVCFLCDLEDRRQSKISKLTFDFNALNETKLKITKQLLVVEKEKNQAKTDLDKVGKELTLAWTTNSS